MTRQPLATAPAQPEVVRQPERRVTSAQALSLAARCFQSGKPAEAVQLCSQVLAVEPENPVANHLFGILALQRGEFGVAVDSIRKAVEGDPSNPEAHNNLANALQEAGDSGEAVRYYESALALSPNSAEFHNNLGNALKRTGRLPEAIEHFERAVTIKPDFAAAFSNLGVALQLSGRLEDALDSTDKALELNAGQTEARFNRGILLQDLGRTEEAIECFRELAANDPTHADASYRLGNLLRRVGRLDESAACISAALDIQPDFVEALNGLGATLQVLGKIDEAIVCFERAIAIRSDFAEAHCNLGLAHQAAERFEPAAEAFASAAAIAPELPQAHNGLGIALHKLGRPDEAVPSYRRAVQQNPDYAEAHNNLGAALQDLGKVGESVEYHEAAIEISPEFAEAYFNLGGAFRRLGRVERAAECYRKVVAIDPDHAEAHRLLSNVQEGSEDSSASEAMEALYSNPDTPREKRMHLGFGLSKANEKTRSYERVFPFLTEANSIKRSSFEYSIERDESYLKRIASILSENFLRGHEGAGNHDPSPIFVLGMPRSGTTLVEQILASHSEVCGAGELDDFENTVRRFCPAGFPEGVLKLAGSDFQSLGGDYLDCLRRYSRSSKFVTDKMPSNFRFIGLIKLAFPEAKIIHCVRDPRDTCYSIYKNFFTGAHPYAYDLEELARYYVGYVGLMNHWRSVVPGGFFELRHEELVRDQESETRRLLEYCGLSWEERCLHFHETERDVATASAVQVRKPMNSDSVKLWTHFKEPMRPLIEILERSGALDGW